MYGPTDLKKNVLITLDGQPYKVVEYSQKVMGRGGSIVNVKVKSDDEEGAVSVPGRRAVLFYGSGDV